MAGDALLKEASRRILQNIGPNDVAARLGGDEFAVIIRDRATASHAARLADRLIKAISLPYEIDDERYKIGVSVGIALAPVNGTRPTQLLRNADLALYRAKAEGRGVFRFFENQMDAEEREKRLLEQELRDAIDGDDFELVYQLQFCPVTGKATGAEALIRWNHPIRGLIHPAEFIPIAEQSSMVQEIGNWAIRKACGAAVNWPDTIVVAVNISGHHFIGSDILTYTRLALEETGLDPKRLELEITESLLMNNTAEAMRTLRSLKELGVTIALDDFGTGYSSLSYVLKFPFDKIKIDRSFVSSVEHDETAQAILRMIASLGETLNISITAEGVETLEQAKFLRTVNCQQVQGYLYARPMRVSDIDAFFARGGRFTGQQLEYGASKAVA
jgi:predicted signal transduction protein with EAL and GGDEF domain